MRDYNETRFMEEVKMHHFRVYELLSLLLVTSVFPEESSSGHLLTQYPPKKDYVENL